MPIRVFSEEEKDVIKEKLLSVGFPLLQEFGVIHMSVPKITKAAEIGTGTFYRFFESKEEYIYQLIHYKRQQLIRNFIPKEVINGERKLSMDEVRSFIELIVDKENSIYANMSLQDEAELFKYMSKKTNSESDNKLVTAPNIEHEKQVSDVFLKWIDVPPEGIDFALLANMMKVLAITAQAKEELHVAAYDRTIKLLIDDIMELIYGKETETRYAAD